MAADAQPGVKTADVLSPKIPLREKCDPPSTDVLSPKIPLIAVGLFGLLVAAYAFVRVFEDLTRSER